jgi:hypothetical protein
MQCILEKFNAYTNCALLWVKSPALDAIVRRTDDVKGGLVRAIVKNPREFSSLLVTGNNVVCDLIDVYNEDQECVVDIKTVFPLSFPHKHVPLVQTHELKLGVYYKHVVGYNVAGVWLSAPWGDPYDGTTYSLDVPRWAGCYVGKEGEGPLVFKLNKNTSHIQPTTYVAKYNAETKHVAWVENDSRTRSTCHRPKVHYLENLSGSTCFLECPPPARESEIVIRGPLLKGRAYSTCIGTRVGRWPDELHYQNGLLTYLGRYIGEERIGGGDGGRCFCIFEGTDGLVVKHELNYEGTTCFQEEDNL